MVVVFFLLLTDAGGILSNGDIEVGFLCFIQQYIMPESSCEGFYNVFIVLRRSFPPPLVTFPLILCDKPTQISKCSHRKMGFTNN